MSGSIWERFPYDPRRAEHAALRASDRDRDVVNDVLGAAYAEGRLTREELDERSDHVVAARTLGELPAVIDDLVAPTATGALAVPDRRAEAERRYRQQRQGAWMGFLTPTLICWVIWASVMFGEFPWPIFVMLGTGVHLLRLVTSREDSIVSIERHLEKKERKELEAKSREDRALPRPPDDRSESPGDP